MFLLKIIILLLKDMILLAVCASHAHETSVHVQHICMVLMPVLWTLPALAKQLSLEHIYGANFENIEL